MEYFFGASVECAEHECFCSARAAGASEDETELALLKMGWTRVDSCGEWFCPRHPVDDSGVVMSRLKSVEAKCETLESVIANMKRHLSDLIERDKRRGV